MHDAEHHRAVRHNVDGHDMIDDCSQGVIESALQRGGVLAAEREIESRRRECVVRGFVFMTPGTVIEVHSHGIWTPVKFAAISNGGFVECEYGAKYQSKDVRIPDIE